MIKSQTLSVTDVHAILLKKLLLFIWWGYVQWPYCSQVHFLRSMELNFLPVTSVQFRNNRKKTLYILQFCTGVSEMKNLSLEGFDIQNEHSVNIELIIKFLACIRGLDFSVFRRSITCWCQKCIQTEKGFHRPLRQ